jgi:betaine-aldehyde dehydrogenase
MTAVSKILVDGHWRAPRDARLLEIRDPATTELLGRTAACEGADLDAACAAARGAQEDWWRKPAVEKAHLFHEISRRLKARERDLSTLMSRETGKPLIEAVDCIEWVTACFDYYAEIARAERGLSLPPVAANQVNFTIKEPYGVVAAIAPFNFPLLLMAWKIAPALAAGNTVVGKPPHQNPLSNLLMAEILNEVLPPGVLNVVTGDGATGEALVQHPEVDLIAFTGSTATGRKIAAQAGAALKKVNLELGGIDPLIVFDDADLDLAVQGSAWSRLLNAGQVCTSSKRFYVVDSVHDEFLRRLKAHVATLRLGRPQHGDTDLGPLISEDARSKVAGQVARLKAEGATLEMGGAPCQPGGLKGWFFEPTIFTGARHGGLATTEEIFGPVISIIRVRDNDEAIRLANDSRYGLGAVIFTKSLYWSMRAMERIKAGSFWINDPLTDNEAGPFGGMRHSGIGRELGIEGLDAFREPKHVHLDYAGEIKNFWFPNSQRPVH